ncbi:hypothetical protein LWF01_17890 [Saxibacter everestensis]|uniref:Uncharacterized protein n=1 Tax=Saxibacter everestensis TaxID=2909229 RepID=A0ABY8QSH1_9MICO|nr:hypothetical protein LWF01_17890 [Brevibacteriaceae bacterium ZFBP1038]
MKPKKKLRKLAKKTAYAQEALASHFATTIEPNASIEEVINANNNLRSKLKEYSDACARITGFTLFRDQELLANVLDENGEDADPPLTGTITVCILERSDFAVDRKRLAELPGIGELPLGEQIYQVMHDIGIDDLEETGITVIQSASVIYEADPVRSIDVDNVEEVLRPVGRRLYAFSDEYL